MLDGNGLKEIRTTGQLRESERENERAREQASKDNVCWDDVEKKNTKNKTKQCSFHKTLKQPSKSRHYRVYHD